MVVHIMTLMDIWLTKTGRCFAIGVQAEPFWNASSLVDTTEDIFHSLPMRMLSAIYEICL
jgi:hypothetical protein